MNHAGSSEEATQLENGRSEEMQDPGCLAELEAFNQQYDLSPSPPFDIDTLSDLACLKDLKLSMEFIKALDIATLDDKCNRLDSASIKRLWNPPTSRPDTTDPTSALGWIYSSQASSLRKIHTICLVKQFYVVTQMIRYHRMIR